MDAYQPGIYTECPHFDGRLISRVETLERVVLGNPGKSDGMVHNVHYLVRVNETQTKLLWLIATGFALSIGGGLAAAAWYIVVHAGSIH